MLLLHEKIADAASVLRISILKVEQEGAITQFVLSRDVFVALPTGYRKSLCYFTLPLIFDCHQPVDCVSCQPPSSTNEGLSGLLFFPRDYSWFC